MKLVSGRGLVLLAVLGSALVCPGQVAPDLEQGMKAFGSYHGGPIDQVGLSNQNLFLRASLLDYSQRGGQLAYPLVLQYNNKNFSLYTPTCPQNVKPGQGACPLTIVFNPNPFANNSASHGNSVTVGFAGLPHVGGPRINTGLSYNGNPIFIQPSSMVMPDGSMHQLVGTDNGGATTDGSGFGGSNSAGPSDSDGTVYGASAEDRNGNQLTVTTDTLGRQLPATPAPTLPPAAPNPSTASLSACPALNYGNQSVTFAYTWSLPTVNGGTLPLILCYADIYVRTNFLGGRPNVFEVNKSFPMLQSVVFPDNTYWAFQYDAADPGNTNSFGYGDLLKATFPTGGSITYTWGMFAGCDSSGFSRGVQTRTVDANDGAGPHTWSYANGVVTDPAGNDTVHTFTGLGGTCSEYETKTQYYQGSRTNGILLKTFTTDYTFTPNPWDPNLISQSQGGVAGTVTNVLPIRVTTTLPNGQTSKVETDYDAGFTYHGPLDGITWNDQTCVNVSHGTAPPNCSYTDPTTNPVTNYTASYGKAVATREYDWGANAPGPLLRQTLTTYQWQISSAYLTANLLNLPATVKVLDGAGNLCAETDYFYDEPGSLTTPSPAITTQHTTPPWTVRGNLTTVAHKLTATPCAANATWSSVSSHTNWYDTGEVYQQIDPLGNTTTHSYDPAYVGAYSTQTQDALGHVVSGTYDFNTGLLTSFTNANATSQANGNTPGDSAHTTNYAYDSLWRMTSATLPADSSGNHPQTSFNYPNATTVERLHKITASLTDDAFTYFDGVGRAVRSRHVTGGNALVDTTYDVLGRAATVTNPYFSTSDLTYGVTQNQYDALGRITQITKQDGSVSTVSYVGNCTTTTDEAGKQRRACSDALGRLSSVWEDPGGLNYETDYQYDALGNLLRVDQKGSAPTDSTQWRTRLFTYDSLSRLLTANNPESGLINYFYDANGNLLQKVLPSPNQTGPATHTISYCYDGLNRVTGKAYSWQNCQNGQLPPGTAVVSYIYDQGTNGIGHMASLTDQAGSGSYSYDILGRMSSEQRTIAGVTKTMGYSYNLDGSVATATYPSGAVITYTPDSAGRTLKAVDSISNINYVTGATYGADSTLRGFVSGQSNSFAGITNTFVYNNRQQPCRTMASSAGTLSPNCDASWGNVLDLRYDFHLGNGDNGNVYGIINYRDQSRNQTFTYDPLNRLLSAQNAGTDCTEALPGGHTEYWGNNYAYDPWGNLLQKTPTKCSAENLNLTASVNNQLQGYTYDAAGNMTHDATANLNYVFDPENRIAGAGGFTYIYDADGNRVEKANGSTGTLYWYMTPGIVAESDLSGNLQSEYVFFDGERVARKDFPAKTIFYYFSDHLKSASVITDDQGRIKKESDFYPWGGELQFVNNDLNKYLFTGKERDSETSLDYFGARYYSSAMSRFTSPDPLLNSGKPWDPQSWNRYSYVRNNPLAKIDPTGLYDLNNTCGSGDKKCNKQFKEHAKDLKNGLRSLQDKLKDVKDPQQKARLESALKALGTEGDHNGVNVSFGATGDGAAGQTNPSVDANNKATFNVTLDPSKLKGEADYAIDAAHEGTHIDDIQNGISNLNLPFLSFFSLEYRGYQTSAWAAQALGFDTESVNGNVIWNSSWAQADRQTLQDKAITKTVTGLDKPGHPDHQETNPHNPWPN